MILNIRAAALVLALVMVTPAIASFGSEGTEQVESWNRWVLFDFDDGMYVWTQPELAAYQSVWDASQMAASRAGLELEYTESDLGIIVDSIDGVTPPVDFSSYWRLLIFNGSSDSWEMSMKGADAIELSEVEGIAWHYSGWTSAFPAATPDHRYPVIDFRGGPEQCGYSGAEPITDPQLEWSMDLGSGPIDATPLTVDRKVYVLANGETNWTTMEVTSDPAVFCLNLETGQQDWKTIIAGNSWQAATPAYYDGTLYLGSTNGLLYAIDAADGTILWEYGIPDSFNGITSSPVVRPDGEGGKAIFFGGGTGEVYSIALNGTLRWAANVGDVVYFSSPLVYDGRVYIGDDGGELNCLDAGNGTLLWNFSTGDKVRSTPALVDGGITFTSRDGKVRSVSPEGGILWTAETGPSHSSVAVKRRSDEETGVTVVFVGSDTGVNRIHLGGYGDFTDWKTALDGPVHSSPVVCGNMVYVQTNVNDGETMSAIYGMRADNGSVLFSLNLEPAEWSASSVVVTDGYLIAASDNGRVYCYTQSDYRGDGGDGGGDGGEAEKDEGSTPGFTLPALAAALIVTLTALTSRTRRRT